MPGVVRLRVVSPILAFKTHGFETIPVDSIIETLDDLEQPGLHSVKVGDQELFAFTRDINERSERVALNETWVWISRTFD